MDNELASRVTVTDLSPRQAGYHAGTVEIRAAIRTAGSGPDSCRASVWQRCPVTVPAGHGGLAEWLEGYAQAIQAALDSTRPQT
jgi:hypothetical protein